MPISMTANVAVSRFMWPTGSGIQPSAQSAPTTRVYTAQNGSRRPRKTTRYSSATAAGGSHEAMPVSLCDGRQLPDEALVVGPEGLPRPEPAEPAGRLVEQPLQREVAPQVGRDEQGPHAVEAPPDGVDLAGG